ASGRRFLCEEAIQCSLAHVHQNPMKRPNNTVGGATVPCKYGFAPLSVRDKDRPPAQRRRPRSYPRLSLRATTTMRSPITKPPRAAAEFSVLHALQKSVEKAAGLEIAVRSGSRRWPPGRGGTEIAAGPGPPGPAAPHLPRHYAPSLSCPAAARPDYIAHHGSRYPPRAPPPAPWASAARRGVRGP